MRLFIAIPLADTVVEELSLIRARLQSCGGDGLRWTSAESWHVTLQFLGTTSHEHCACVMPRLHALRAAPVPIVLEGLGFFDRAGVFFAGVRPTPALIALQERVVAATGHCGFVPEERPFQPHITLARSKGSGQHRMEDLQRKIRRQPAFTRFVANEFLLYESFLGAGGSRYEVRERFTLHGR